MFDPETIINVKFTPPVEETGTARFETEVHPGISLDTAMTAVALIIAEVHSHGHSELEIMLALARVQSAAQEIAGSPDAIDTTGEEIQ